MQETRFNLPVKYGIMPIINNGKIKAYIACKCYLIEHNIKYLKKGIIDSYKVVYFYNNNLRANYPIFSGEKCLNAIEEEVIFEDFASAQRLARVKNSCLAYKAVSNENIILNNINELYQSYYDIESMLEQKSEETNIVDIKSYKKRLK